jgi:hypothetical protein
LQPYNPEQFAPHFAKPIGPHLWGFVNRPDMVARMEAASEMGRPAVEGIAEPLIAEFGPPMRQDPLKAMVDHMARQVLEPRGWVVQRVDNRAYAYPFTKGTRFIRNGWFPFHVFRDADDPTSLCLTADRRGETLPTDPPDRQWTYWTRLNSPASAAIGLNLKSFDLARQAVMAKGHYLHRMRRPVAKGAAGKVAVEAEAETEA